MLKYTTISNGRAGNTNSALPHSVEFYLQNGAPEGNRNHSLYAAASQLRDIDMPLDEAHHCLIDRALNDGLSESEATSTIQSAFRGTKREAPSSAGSSPSPGKETPSGKGRDYQLRRGGGGNGMGVSDFQGNQGNKKHKVAAMENATSMSLPDPIEDGFEELLKAAFEPEEGVCVGGTFQNDDGIHMPDGGVTLTREKWIERVRQRDGDFAKMHTSKEGHYIRLNPMRIYKGSKNTNADVSSFRHCLVEFDADENGKVIPKEKQLGAILASGLPVTAVIDSGNKSIHAWVRVDAENEEQYRERAAVVYEQFGEELDGQNHNPNRYSRVPDGKRTVKGEVVRQSLLKLDVGAKSWEDWETKQLISELGEEWTVDDLENYPIDNDPNTVIGNRWMCKGGSFVFVSQSGVGKSSMQMQFAVGWALGRDDMTFGVKPIRPLKQLVIQAENDQGDVAEGWRDITAAYGLTSEDKAEVKKMIKWRRLTSIAGPKFLATLQQLVAMEKPDVCWIDPLINYIGDDISKAEVISEFCDIGLGTISRDTGTIFGIIHHTGKPKDSQTKEGMHASDLAYMGIGSSNLTNWAREVVVLNRMKTANDDDPATFSLTATKRRTRAGFKQMPADGDPIDAEKVVAEIYVRHSDDGTIRWDQCPRPEAPKRGRPAGSGKKETSGTGATLRRRSTASRKVPGRPKGDSFSAAQKRELMEEARKHGWSIPAERRKQLQEEMCKSEKTIRRYLYRIAKYASEQGLSEYDAAELELKNSAEDAVEVVDQGSEFE